VFSDLRASDTLVAATPARGDDSTCGTIARAFSSDSTRLGVELHADKAATIAAVNTT
jgi:hypothetical protein